MFTDDRPIFQQLADLLADDIAAGVYPEGAAIPSATDLGVFFRLNPATVSRGVNLLVDRGVLFKKRGVGIFVAPQATDALRRRRQDGFEASYIEPMLREAALLGIDPATICQIISNRVKDKS
ncbi:GntR family transcriptional regulator [Paeniglutamicibacter gangotriensis]|uniref:GntR family transcriptional regulator n=1 Tax=Paeniglutamicibacter gangotriensis TaxID=254787 RepID=A0A5B0ECQ3_9MICC|nr:GntR family transcriptional regulator [Paeniglutamicibacter gangotriensis]KAA0976518.1 GntR family transcriptional regulator [Paeniglutamicibacter gangotriensis]